MTKTDHLEPSPPICDISAKWKELGLGYGRTFYASSDCLGTNAGKQSVGSYTLYFSNGNFRISNDIWGDKEDRWRTSAAELTLKSFSLGTYIVTNYGERDGGGRNLEMKAPWPIGDNRNGLGAWNNGKVYSAPFWIGIKTNGSVFRIGYSHEIIQNLTQNLVHSTRIGPQSYYLNYTDLHRGIYSYFGYNNPLSIWNF